MGALNCCLPQQGYSEGVGVRTPLLSNQHRQPQSARTYSPSHGTGKYIENNKPRPIYLKKVKVAEVDKRLEDHAKLYNEQLRRRNDLWETMEELRHKYGEKNRHQTLAGCLYRARELCGEAIVTVTIKRKHQHCMEIEANEKEIHYEAIEAFHVFNKANRLIKDILDRGPPLVNSLEMVLKGERELKRSIMLASLGKSGPDSLKICMENLNQLKRVPTLVTEMKSEAIAWFEELKAGAHVLFKDPLT